MAEADAEEMTLLKDEVIEVEVLVVDGEGATHVEVEDGATQVEEDVGGGDQVEVLVGAGSGDQVEEGATHCEVVEVSAGFNVSLP